MTDHIAAVTPRHSAEALAIHQSGIDEGNATFETAAPDWPTFDAAKLPEHRLVALDETEAVLGWAAVTRVSDRCATAAWSSIPSTSPPTRRVARRRADRAAQPGHPLIESPGKGGGHCSVGPGP
jgi:hypothetical protein